MSASVKIARAAYRGDASMRAMPGTGYRQAYMGDPGLFGFIGKAVKGIAKTVGGAVAGFARGGPLGAIGGAIGAHTKTRPTAASMERFQGALPSLTPGFGGGFPQLPGGGRFGPSLPSGAPRPGPQGGRGTPIMAGPGGECPPGYHPNKTGYWVTSPQGTPSYVSPGERCVRARRRNPLNPRAADRAISRLKSARKAVRKIEKFFPKSGGGKRHRAPIRISERGKGSQTVFVDAD